MKHNLIYDSSHIAEETKLEKSIECVTSTKNKKS